MYILLFFWIADDFSCTPRVFSHARSSLNIPSAELSELATLEHIDSFCGGQLGA